MGARRRWTAQTRSVLVLFALVAAVLGVCLVLFQDKTAAPEEGQSLTPSAAASEGRVEAPEELTSVMAASDAGVSSFTEKGSVEQVATHLLSSYQERGDCVLASSGYVDLLGSAWSCVVQGGDWVDVCTVFEDTDTATCEVRVLRLEADEVRELF